MPTALSKIVVPFSVKAESIDKSARTFEGLAATWGLDLGNDRITKGAFKNTIKEWKASSEALPLLNSHNHWDVMAALGQLLEAKETDEGLLTKWEVIEEPDGDKLLTRLRPSARTGRAIVGKMSIGYEPVKWGYEQPPGTEAWYDRIRILEEVKLKEVSVVLFPMNPGASIDSDSVKSFLDLTTHTDPKRMHPALKGNLRKLAARIGVLLKSEPVRVHGEDDEFDDDAFQPQALENENKSSPTPTPPPPVTPPATPPAPAPQPPAPAPSPTPTPPTPVTPSEKSDDVDDSTKADDAPAQPVYQFAEALEQRLRAVSLKHKMANISSMRESS